MFLYQSSRWPQYSNSQHPQGSKRRNPDMHVKKKSLTIPGKGAPLPCSPAWSLWIEMLHLQRQWFIHSYISVGVPKKEPSHKMWGKHIVIVHGAPRGQKAYIQWGAAWFHKGMFNDTAITTPQCHAAFSTIPSTVAWVDQSPVSQHVL
jgi:hypothetical protein